MCSLPTNPDGRQVCPWCGTRLAEQLRRDARFCSQRCRQASHRFGAGCVAQVRADASLRLAYADPPYPGLAARYYGEEPDYAGEVDHPELLSRLQEFDAWALSTSSRALPDVLAECLNQGAEVRVAAWFRGARGGGRTRWPRQAWEPVVYAGGRRLAEQTDALDALQHVARPRTTDPRRLVGTKPAAFWWWLFELLGARPGDTFFEPFPGSGGGARAWAVFCEPSRRALRDASDLPRGDASAGRDASDPSDVDARRVEASGSTSERVAARAATAERTG